MVEQSDKPEKAEKAAEKPPKGGKPALTPEQEAEAAAKKAARAAGKEGKGKEAKGGKGKGAAAGGGKSELASERVKRAQPSRLRKLFETELRQRLMSELGLSNVMQAPRMVKITVNMGLGEAITNPKILDAGVEDLSLITGQKPVITKSKKAIAAFKLKANQKLGAVVTLRRDSMYEFFDRLVSFALPRVRDFKGVSPNGFDGRGNYTLGVREGNIFPEASFERVEKSKGMNITITTTARTDEQGRALLRHLGMPFRS
jgi:large subunit ribosomal protein L5